MRRVRSTDEERGYGLGFWLDGAAAYLTGSDTGASFVSQHLPGTVTWSVLGNITDGAWPVAKVLDELLIKSPSTDSFKHRPVRRRRRRARPCLPL